MHASYMEFNVKSLLESSITVCEVLGCLRRFTGHILIKWNHTEVKPKAELVLYENQGRKIEDCVWLK